MTSAAFEIWATTGYSRKAHSDYTTDPIRWAVEKLGVRENTLRWSLNPGYSEHRWDGTINPLVAIAEAIANSEDVGVESGTGTGKSFFAAVLILWFLACWEGSRVFTFAPKEDQLRLYIWMEIGKLWLRFLAHFPDAELTDLTIRMNGGTDDSWGARGYAVGVKADEQVATKAAGMHAEHMLLVYEEGPGIPTPVFEAGEQTCTAPHNLRMAVGNPDNQLDPLHQFCIRSNVTHVRISAYDHPNIVTGNANVVPGAVSQVSVERRRQKDGENSPLYKSRIRGISPTESVTALIRMEWIKEAQRNSYALVLKPHRKRAMGVDVANSLSGDEGAIARGLGAVCESVESFPCPNANHLGRKVAEEAKSLEIDAYNVGVDGVGVGAGCVNQAHDLGVWVRSLNGGDSAVGTVEVEKFNNLRSQMWWQARLDLARGEVGLPEKDDELIEDLITPTWKAKNGKIVVESKEDIKKRLPSGRSPNKGDAFVYWNWVRPREVPLEVAPRPTEEMQGFATRDQTEELEWINRNASGPDYGYQLTND